MFPKKDYSNLSVTNLFGSFDINETDLQELNKKVYNYINYEQAKVLTVEEKSLLKSYYKYLLSFYFTHEDITLDNNSNNILFNYNQWNIMKNYILNYQSFAKDYFNIFYNNFTKNQFNKVFSIETNSFNNYINRLNKIYKNNKFEDGKPIFKKLTIDKFNSVYKNIYNNYKSDQSKKVGNIVVTDKKPSDSEATKPTIYFIIEK